MHVSRYLNPSPSPTMSTPYVTQTRVDEVLVNARARSELDECTLHALMRDTIDIHGLRWAMAYYAKRLQPWELRVFMRAALDV